MGPNTPKARDLLVALLLAAVTFSALGLAQTRQGVMRDEATYFHAAERYWGFFESLAANYKVDATSATFTKRNIDRYFADNHLHPILMKLLFGLSWRAFHKCHCTERGQGLHALPVRAPHKTLELMSEISAFRLPGWLMTAFGVALIYLFGVRVEGRMAGLTAALLYISMPRAFFHGQLACFDAGITTMWLAVVYGYYRSLDSARWGILTGILFGLAIATKHNAYFIPFLLLIHYFTVVWPDLSLRPLRLPRVALVFLAMAILGPLLFYGHWPWIWSDTYARLNEYFSFHLKHSFYNIEYLGKNWGLPPLPISYPFGMLLFTAPTMMLMLALAGIWVYARPALLGWLGRHLGVRAPRLDDDFRFPAKRSWLRPGKGLNPRIGTLFVLNALFPIVLIALPQTPIFGGAKHFMPAWPFLALLAGVALGRLRLTLRAQRPRLASLTLLLPLLVAAPGVVNTALTHPFGLSQYNALAGGPAGGADLGLNRQFWGYAPRQLLPWINETFPKGANVYWHDVMYGAYGAYIRDGLLRPDIRYAGMELPAIRSSTHAMVIHELHFNKYDHWIWDAYGSSTPIKVLTLDGVPLVSVYQRPKGARR